MLAFAFPLSTVVDWLGTFAVHSTLALGAAWLVSVALRKRALALQELLLRTSMWLALVSASVQCAVRGSWMPEFVLSPEAAPAALVDAGLAAELADAGIALPAALAPAWWNQLAWPTWALLMAGAASLGGLVWLGVVHRRLRRVLAARRPETDARVLTTAAEVARSLGMQQSPHVSRSASIATPIAFGFVRPEICLPERVGELSSTSLRAMLAHEVAHLRAADPAWMWGAVWLQALFPWQVLFVAVRRRWARLVELRCDAIAAEHATPTAVARCLLDVADWLRPGPEGSVAALGMAARPSALRERVEAALQGAAYRPARRGLSRLLAAMALAALTAGAPAVATDQPVATAPSTASTVVTEAPTPAPARQALAALIASLQSEHATLVAEADSLRRAFPRPSPAPDQLQLQAAIDRRLAAFDRLRTRLLALLALPESTTR